MLQWVMADSVRKGNKEMQERVLLMQKEKDQVSVINPHTCALITWVMVDSVRKVTWEARMCPDAERKRPDMCNKPK